MNGLQSFYWKILIILSHDEEDNEGEERMKKFEQKMKIDISEWTTPKSISHGLTIFPSLIFYIFKGRRF